MQGSCLLAAAYSEQCFWFIPWLLLVALEFQVQSFGSFDV